MRQKNWTLRQVIRRLWGKQPALADSARGNSDIQLDHYWAALLPMLARLIVECERQDGRQLDAAQEWLIQVGLGGLMEQGEQISANTLDAARLVHRGLYLADEVMQLDGIQALDYAAGFVLGDRFANGGFGRLRSTDSDAAEYALVTGRALVSHHHQFCAGFERAAAEARARRARSEREIWGG